MKKIISFLLVLLISFSCIGCSQEEITDGTYWVEVTLGGGTGRSSIEKASVEIREGSALATIVWSSPFYEYMLIDGNRYEPLQKSGNATFSFPIVFDEEMEVTASTIAMSQPYLIDYTLYFDSSTLEGE